MQFDELDVASLRRRHGKKWRTYPPDVLPAWVADMDFPIAAPIRRAIEEMVALDDYGYPHARAGAEVAELLAARLGERFGWKVEPQRIELVNDVIQAMYIALEVFGEPGQRALIQTPIYPPFLDATADTGRPAAFCPLVRRASGYEMDFDAMGLAVTAETRFFLLCNPHNPTGRVFARRELERIGELALRHDLIVIADEIHADLVYDGGVHLPFASLDPEVGARTVTLTSATKAFNIAGLRCAAAIFGSQSLQDRFRRVHPHVRGGLSRTGLAATRAAWESCSEWLEALVRYLQGNRDLVAAFLSERMPKVEHRPPQATYLYWLDFRALGLREEPYDFFLRQARVALSPGPDFGAEGAGHARLNLGTSREMIADILERMAVGCRAL